MSKLKHWLVVLTALSLLSASSAEQETVESVPLRLSLDLVDGSHVIGVPNIKSVPVQTSYAKMDIPLRQIRSIKIADDHETASLELQNGDKLTAVLGVGPIELGTIFGKTTIGLEHIEQLDVVLTGRALPQELKRGLVLHYSFDKDEGTKVSDQSGKRQDGKVHGVKWVAKGQVGGAYEFTRGKIASAHSNSPYFENNEPFTVSLCFQAFDNEPSFLVLRNANYGIKWNGAGRGLQMYTGNYLRSVKTDWETRRWYHVVAVDDGKGICRIYVNGALDIRQECPPNRFGKFPLEIGHYANEHHFRGIIDEVMIWNRVLSEDDIKQLYNSQK